MKKVIIFTYLQRHLKKMIPVIQRLESDSDIDLSVILMTDEEREIAEKFGLTYSMLDEFTDKKRQYDFDLNWGLEPLINAIDRIQPDLFCAIEVNYILRNAVRYCKKIGIKTIIVQHGTPNVHSLHAFLPFEGDLFLAWGEFAKEYLVKNGMDEKKVILTGGISFDRTLSLIPDRMAIADELKISADKKWIVFTTQGVGAGNRPSAEEIFAGVSEVSRAMLNKNEYELIFQVHPSQESDYIKNIVDTIEGTKSIICRYHDTEELMKASAGVITFFSTTAIDAILLRKPLMLINLSKEPDFFPFVEIGAAVGAYSKDEIKVSSEMLLNRTTIDEKLLDIVANKMNYLNDGKALERVMDIIYKNIYGGS